MERNYQKEFAEFYCKKNCPYYYPRCTGENCGYKHNWLETELEKRDEALDRLQEALKTEYAYSDKLQERTNDK